jgi:CheY-like chemotaxis protein
MEALDLNSLVKNLVTLCGHSFESRIQVLAKLPEGETWILADRSQLEQAVLNICVNARDAMKGGGTLTLSVGHHVVDDAFRKRHTACDARELAVLSIRDTGEGIPLGQIDKIFEPFFTTKRENGSGLGLTIVDSIVKQHKGCMEVDSDPKTGTTFRLYIPLAESMAIGAARKAVVRSEGHDALLPADAPTGKGEILVVDDDEIIRGTAARIMGELGYTPATAADGASAIRMLESGLHFDLVVLDVDMPVMNGLDTADVLWRIKPSLRILFCTGRQHQYEMKPVMSHPNAHLVLKPFDMAALAGKVREALSAG